MREEERGKRLQDEERKDRGHVWCLSYGNEAGARKGQMRGGAWPVRGTDGRLTLVSGN